MKVTKQQKILLGIACAGLVFLVYDQMGGPASAVGQSVVAADHTSAETIPTAPVPAPAITPTAPTGVPSGKSLATRLDELSTTNLSSKSLRDPFASLSSVSGANASASAFATKYRMTGVIASANTRSALVNGQVVRLGQTVDGYRLTQVDARGATFQSATERVVLSIE